MTQIEVPTRPAANYDPSSDEFWSDIDFELDCAEELLFRTHLETREEALAGTYRRGEKGSLALDVIRRRHVHPDQDQLDYYWKLGRALYPQAMQLALQRQLTLQFARILLDLRMCQGFLVAHLMDDSDDLTAHRGGEKNRQKLALQRKWLAHFIAPRLGKRGTKKAAFGAALDLIYHRISSPNGSNFGPAWYRVMLNEAEDDWTSSLRPDRFETDDIRRLAQEPDNDIPPR